MIAIKFLERRAGRLWGPGQVRGPTVAEFFTTCKVSDIHLVGILRFSPEESGRYTRWIGSRTCP